MQFTLNEPLLEDVLFAMESADGNFCFDTHKGQVARLDSAEGESEGAEKGRFIDLPRWDSASGFALMERFTASLRAKPAQDALFAALKRGKGVFRAFKDTLSRFPEHEKAWLAYKNREMRKTVYAWYNGLREEWRLSKAGEEPEETADLVLEDFRFRSCGRDEAAQNLLPPGWEAVIAAETPGGVISALSAFKQGEEGHFAYIFVKEEYRGLGLGESLLQQTVDLARKSGKTPLFIDVPSEVEGFERVLLREAFTRLSSRWEGR